ncbi:ATP-binding cassette domain-containing protein [Zunongwangia profunda]|uniref:Anion transport protein (ABC superfamily, ATP-binding protein) n=2 Tax=Zunongwangia profunda TaxID=398743 RepID=D5BLA4_ZUNPS|nr:ATP-binding cassette domain-containing protein [Zunongwangia profunda]ADF54030.1 putative anion transport protein (ABC superfamily, ATP-binding protein) [Zunongwangia profunda SM-A87]HCV80797.1 ABC transporter [Zunongwangia profunda]|tara:strand:+ start:35 stop:1273 length:1239 start_codon:yes stop_codon:yes gene_type:complete
MRHLAIYARDHKLVSRLIDDLKKDKKVPGFEGLQHKNGFEHSEAVLQNFIKDDQKHGNSVLVKDESRSLRTFSSGEKRKALLEYLLKKQPEYLILDDPFDCLDVQSVANFKERLAEVKSDFILVQIFRREEDILPFIDIILDFDGAGNTVFKNKADFIENKQGFLEEIKRIPAAPKVFEGIPESLIQLKNVNVAYEDRPILSNISWEVKRSEFWKLTGPNGSGKTTILSMIYGDNPKAYGVDLFLFGKKKGSGESVWEIKKKIGYFSPSITELFIRRNSVEEMLISGLVDSIGLYQKPSDKQRALAKQWLETLGFQEKAKKVFNDLSNLEKRMLLIARAMIKHPPLLILDEPSTGLDDKSALKITNLINHIAAQSDTAIIYVSHRKEKGLHPDFEYELFPTENGSVGKIKIQ